MSNSRYAHRSLSGLIDSDFEDAHFDESTMPTSDSAAENRAPAKTSRAGKKASVSRVTKAKAAPTRKGRRPALTDKTNAQSNRSDTEEVDEFEQEDATMDTIISVDELDASIVSVRPQRSRAAKAKPASKSTKAIKDISSRTEYTIQDDAPEAPRLNSRAPATKKVISLKRQASAELQPREKIIQETQVSALDVDDYGDDEGIEEPTPKPVVRRTNLSRSTSQSRQPPVIRRRAGSASDTERNDPALRRKVGDLTQKLENLELKYRNLREIGIQEAEQNFERHKKQSDESLKAASAVIAALKSEIATQNVQLKDYRTLKRQSEAKDSEISKLRAKVAELTSSLTDTRAENKTLSTKIAATRTAAASAEAVGSKIPAGTAPVTVRMMGSAEVIKAAQESQLKENVYSDFTDLIIRAVKRDAGEDVFDCIQTGKNGTLHFKFSVVSDKGDDNQDEPHCTYLPQLDPGRDKKLLETLPEYLTDEIVFPTGQAGKFYSRVVKALNENPNW